MYQLAGEELQHLALVSLASPVDQALLLASSGALSACNFTSGHEPVVVKVQSIQSVVSMLPFPLMTGDKLMSDTRYFVIEDFGKAMSDLTDGAINLYEGEENNVEDDEHDDSP